MQTVRKYGTDYQKECHSGNEEFGQLVEALFIFKEKVEHCNCNIHKPEQVGHNEIFTKWYEFVKW